MEAANNQIVESVTQVDLSSLILPLVTIYEKPADFPEEYVARLWDGKGPRATNTIIKRASVRELREDLEAAGFTVCFPRAAGDEPQIVETWMR